MNTYLVTRPYCNPRQVVVLAETKKEALQLCKRFGYVTGTKAKKITKKGIVIAISPLNHSQLP